MQFKEITEIMKNSGVAGAGGAGFPTYAKLDKRADTIILNCAECEPLLKVHQQVMEKYAYEIMNVLAMTAKSIDAKDVVIAIKSAYKDAIEAIESNLESFPMIRIGLLPEVYPAGDEVVAIYETTGRVVPPGDIPISVGVTVFNVESILNVYNAIHSGKTVTEKYITVAGEVEEPITVKVPIGISVAEVVKQAGGAKISDPVYIMGGPMTGIIVSAQDRISKTSNAILVVPKNHIIVEKRISKTSINMKRAMSACCQCRMCTDLCPRHLLGHPIEPHEFMQAATSGVTKKLAPFLNTMFCSQCGICEMYACMQGLNPRTLIGVYKEGLRANGVPMQKEVPLSKVNPNRENRKVPMKRLIARLGLTKYNLPAPLKDELVKTDCVKINLKQNIGASAIPVVKLNEKVSVGQLIGEAAEGKLSLPVHASIDGVVTDINDKYITIKAKQK